MSDLVHHLIHFLMYSLVLWQLVLGLWVILIWASRNIKFRKSPILNISESLKSDSISEDAKVKKDLGPTTLEDYIDWS